MRKIIVPILALATLAIPAVAQDLGGRRDEARGPGGRGNGPPLRRLIERLSERLDFDDEQTARIEKIVATHEERMQEMRAQRQKVRAAMEAGDEQRAAELRGQLRQQRGERGRFIEAVFDEIEPVLYEGQTEAFQQFRAEFTQRLDRRGERGRMREMMRGLPDAVNMTENQRKEFEELFAKRQELMGRQMRQHRQRGEGGGFAGGEHPAPPDFTAARDELFSEISGILNEDQLELLAEYWAPIESETAAREKPPADDFRLLLLAAKLIPDLSREQKETWRQITREAMGSLRDLRRTDKEGKAALAAEVKAKIVKLLDEEQTKAFERNLERLKSRHERAKQSPSQTPNSPGA